MNWETLVTALSQCADPVLILGDTGAVLWENSAYDNLRTKTSGLRPDHQKVLLKTEQFATYPLELPSTDGATLALTAIVTEIGSGDPDSLAYLVILKAIDSSDSHVVAKEELLAAVAHDLRNPLGAIFAYADALLDTSAGEGLTGSQREVLRRIRSTASRSVDLVLNYQLLARLQSKGFLRAGASSDLNESVRTVLNHAWREDEHVAPVETSLSTVPMQVGIEKVQVERAVANIVSNAFKYTPESGKIFVSTEPRGEFYAVIVQNTGTSIPEYELPLIFDRYRRASSSVGKGGSGLGLYIVKTILETAGGKVVAESSPELGVRISLLFPRA